MIPDPIPCPAGLEGDTGWRGALHILNCPLLRAKGVGQFVDLKDRSIYFRKLLRAAGVWSSGEILLVKVAASLFSYEFKAPPLWEVVNRLDDDNVALVAEALLISAGIRPRSALFIEWRVPKGDAAPHRSGDPTPKA